MIDAKNNSYRIPFRLPKLRVSLLASILVLFLATVLEYLRGAIGEQQAWMWPMLFVPLSLYVIGLAYGDIPARYYSVENLQPFPAPFSQQFDRSLLAIIVLYTGITLNLVLLFLSIAIFETSLLLKLFYVLYLTLMLIEVPTSLRIFRFIQHVNTVQYVTDLNPNLFKNAASHLDRKTDPEAQLENIYQSLLNEAKSLVTTNSPLSEDQQIALNLAVRSGESIRRAGIAKQEGDWDRLRDNSLILEALHKKAGLNGIPNSLRFEPTGEKETLAASVI